ncbi:MULTISPECIES: hypothetical protein [Burkholderia]|uniref:hypothetical protein n=1 Tax=Burkholderia TaxID=32008 RepID=UPI0009DD2577|nr:MULTISPECIES: hypothetical protein [Burkholderia]
MYKEITPSTDWFFVHDGHNENAPPVVWHVAAWGLTEEGEVVGLIGAFGREDGSKGKTPRLIQVPAVPGSYLHLRQLTAAELELATKRSRQQSDA